MYDNRYTELPNKPESVSCVKISVFFFSHPHQIQLGIPLPQAVAAIENGIIGPTPGGIMLAQNIQLRRVPGNIDQHQVLCWTYSPLFITYQ